ncbi:MAG: rod shape-determining protein [Firmicutes bacterium]|nr:rod shape-determining protein [Bacillota bacterium]
MDFVIQMDSARTLVYMRDVGLVFNEPTCVATVIDKRGRMVVQSIGNRARKSTMNVTWPISDGVVSHEEELPLFLREVLSRLSITSKKPSGIFLIPSSLSAAEISAYKTAVYASGIYNAVFIPGVITQGLANEVFVTQQILGAGPACSVILGHDKIDICIIENHQITDGGTVDMGVSHMVTRTVVHMRHIHGIDLSREEAADALHETRTLFTGDQTTTRAMGRDPQSGTDREIAFTGIIAAEILTPIYQKIARAIKKVINGRPIPIIIGGMASDTPGLGPFLSREFGHPITIAPKSVLSPITGAATLLSDSTLLQKIVELC